MIRKKVIKEIVFQLEQGKSNDQIAKSVGVSKPTVWAIKRYWKLGRYKQSGHAEENLNNSDEQNINEKACAIRAGFEVVAEQNLPSEQDSAKAFSLLLAMVTSPKNTERDAAKKKIREYAYHGGWKDNSPSLEIGKPTERSSPAVDFDAAGVKKPPRRWLPEDDNLLVEMWTAVECPRDLSTITTLQFRFDRTKLALIMRLFKNGALTVEEGDDLCVVAGTPILLSETGLVKTSERSDLTQTSGNYEDESLQIDALTAEIVSARLCNDCSQPIPNERLEIQPYAMRCSRCQSQAEKRLGYHRYVDEGIAGTREANKQMRASLRLDMLRRTKD